MNIVVCVKQVPDVASIRIDRRRMTIIREGVESIINPLDCAALEAAFELCRRHEGSVTALTMGPAQSEEALREALALGADRALLLSDPALAGADTLATSHVLARAVARMDPFPELVLCGRQTIDSDTGHVGPQIAEELNLPQVCGAAEIHMEEGSLIVKNMEDGVVQTLRVTLPAVITVSGEMPPPPPVTLGRLEKAFSDGEVLRWGLEDLGLAPEEVGFAGSANRVRKLHRPPPKGGGEIFSGSPQRLLEHLLRKLESLSILDEEEEAKDA